LNPSEEYRTVQAAADGDKPAFETLVRENRVLVYNLALKLLKNPEDAMDASQDAFVKAYINLKSFRFDCKFSVWIYRITYNVCLDMLRHRERRPEPLAGEEGETALSFAPALEGNPETAVNKKEFWAEINEGLDMLPEKQRQAIILREITGLSYYEIAQISGCTEGTVKSRIARGREKLADFLIKRGTFAPGKRHNSAKGGEAK
jgi:RNA polymerase sigma factor (sigma-70 family)